MTLRNIFYIALTSMLWGCNDSVKEQEYQLSDLTPEMTKHISEKLKEADILINKYHTGSTPGGYDAAILEDVFEKWRNNKDTAKEKPEYVVEAIGAALGQDFVNTLNCEWKILTDQQGTDLTVIHKKYQVNSFPFSSVEKAYLEKRIETFQAIKLALKEKIREAEKGEVRER